MSVVDQTSSAPSRHDRTVVAMTVLAVLLAVGGPTLAARWEGGLPHGPVERVDLTDNARRVLAEVPGAYEDAGVVVVPAATDPYVAWTGSVTEDRIVGEVVELGVRGITRYGSLPPVAAPDWLFDVGVVDAVISDVGDLSFACVQPIGETDCSGTLLTRHIGQWFAFGKGLGAPGESGTSLRLTGLGEDGFVELLLGWLPSGAVAASADLVVDGAPDVPARTAAAGSVSGPALWWLVSPDAVGEVVFLDEHGAAVAEQAVDG